MKNKRAGFEMSITTLVVIVIAVVMLILGLVLVRQIFGTATETVTIIDEQVKNELMNLFGEQGKEMVVKLGTQQTAKVKQGTQGFGFIFGIAPEGVTDLRDCKYTITKKGGDCIEPNPTTWFVYGMTDLGFDEISQNTAFALIKLNIPSSQQPCQQKFTIEATCGTWSSSTYFNIDIIRKGFL